MAREDVMVKEMPALRVAECSATVAGYGTGNIGPIFDRLVPRVLESLGRCGARPGICIGFYGPPAADGSVRVHVAFEVGDQEVLGGDGVEVAVLPAGEVASLVHRGGPEGLAAEFGRLYGWIGTSGRHPVGPGRELYLEWHPEDHSRSVTELQVPLAGGTGD